MAETGPGRGARVATRVWVISALVGSFAGAVLDALVYPDGGSMLMKIGLVAGPATVWMIARRRAGRMERKDDT